MTVPTPEQLRDVAVELARQAGALLLEGHGQAHDSQRKDPTNLVTVYDLESERLLVEAIASRFPDHAVLAEESGARTVTGSKVRWIVDPLDGTTNYAHNYPFFAVSIGVEVEGRVVAGAVYDPVRDEMFAAAEGRGATLNRGRIHVSEVAGLEDALIVTGFPYDVRDHPDRSLAPFRAFLVRAQGIRRDGSAALNICYLAMGRFDGFWEEDLAPWDIAAGTVILREAGGMLTDYGGAPLRLDGRQILASNGRIHDEMKAVLAGVSAVRG